MPIKTRVCNDCGKKFDVLDRSAHSTDPYIIGIDRDDKSTDCPGCNSSSWRAGVNAGVGVRLGGSAGHGKFFPRYDNGLGCMIESEEHRLRVCRERGVEPTEGAIDLEPYKEAKRARDKQEADFAEYKDLLDNSPDFSDYREARDKGLIDDSGFRALEET